MKYLIFLLFISLQVGCQKVTVFEVEPAMMPYYQQFVKDGRDRGRDVSTDNLVVKFGDVPSMKVIAFCTTDSRESMTIQGRKYSETPMVIFNSFWWDVSNDIQRQETMTHELGHCLLKYGHNDSRSVDGFLDSIMSSFSITRLGKSQYQVYVNNLDGYLDQFFGLKNYALRGSNRRTNTSKVSDNYLASKTWVSTVDGCDGRESTNEDVELVQEAVEKIRAKEDK